MTSTQRPCSPPRRAPFVGSDLQDPDFDRIRDLLLERRGLDLTMYKDRCIKRRIAARIRSLGAADAAAYLERLQADEAECDQLLAALSIHVSQFFRNPATFRTLAERILPELAQRVRTAGRQELRLWSAGCAGGEEAYSLALLLAELAPLGVQSAILGTDVSPPVLERARLGLFEPQRLSEVPLVLLARYFVQEGLYYRLHQEVRRQVRFECHNLLTAPQFPEVDLILCRNVLIYFSRAEQENILGRFAAALAPDGILVLGKAETFLGESRKLFIPENGAERIFRKAAAAVT